MSYLHRSSPFGCVGGYSHDNLSVVYDFSLAPLDPEKRCQFFYDVLFVLGSPSSFVIISRFVSADKFLTSYDKEWLIDYCCLFFRDLTGCDMADVAQWGCFV